MSGWTFAKLADLCQISIGRTPPRGDPKFWDASKSSGNVWLSIADLPHEVMAEISKSKEHLTDLGASLVPIVPTGTLIMSFKLSIGRTAISSRELRTNEAIAAFSQLETSVIDQRFLGHFLSSQDWNARLTGDEKMLGATLNKSKMAEIQIPLPPLDEQKRIVAKLDEAHAQFGRLSNNLDLQVDAIDDFGSAVLNDSLTRSPMSEVHSPSSSAAASLTAEPAVSEWAMVPLGQLCEILDSKRKPITKSDRVSGQIPYFGASGVLDYVNSHIFDEKLVLLGEDGAKWNRGDRSAFIIEGLVTSSVHSA